ncbi:hypothetical protein [Corynebacterium diphtheriae]|uniref:hypothetical protein n=1 Tax=Corynebacterium diphtheriae TaxID=1717 RepID=UPI0013C6FD87|nr:hypothetical protein [Corynebacterium diphtheriae]CAB0627760.1 DNA primase [Corynebacterium diphtheriae]CAB0638917.1 DNA primase [Corynebacterium diphtheriae]
MKTTCEQCKCDFDAAGARGRTPKYCSGRCRQRAHRARASVLPAFMRERVAWCRADGKRPIMLGRGLGCYDLDHCYIDGVLDGWASEFIKTIDEPIIYAERSISGEGLHIFIKTDERAGQKLRFMGKTVEAYTRQRFIRTTLNTAKEVMAYARSGA